MREDYNITVDVWSVTSYNELRREALQIERKNTLNPDKKPVKPFVTDQLSKEKGPIISATDYMKIYSDQLREFMPDSYRVLGTDGFGRSDTREKLRHFFEIDSKYIVLAALTELRSLEVVSLKDIRSFMKSNGISSTKPDPVST